jgi:transposase
MLKMDQVHIVRHKVLIEKLSQRQVATDLGLSRNTVSKYLSVPEPLRQVVNPRSATVGLKAAARIEELLVEWRDRTTAKQHITGSRLHRQLREEGIQVGKTTVYEILRQKRILRAEVFIPLFYQPADCAQVDFFEVTVEIDSIQRKAWKFLMRLMYSGYDFVFLYWACDQLSFLDAHLRAFNFFGGVPHRLVYDNLSAAVGLKAGLHGPQRKLTERFAALSSHYLFEPCFARPGEGHDKGGVESRGRMIRLQHLTPIPVGQSLSQIATGLQQDLMSQAQTAKNAEGQTIISRFAEEREVFKPLPATPFEARRVRTLEVSSRSTVQVEGATYSVPSRWARQEVTALIGVEEIAFTRAGETQTHKRVEKGAKSIRYRHYLSELARKPQAVGQVAPRLIEELGEPFGKLWELLYATHGGLEAARTLARLLGVINKADEESVRQLLEQALSETTSSRAISLVEQVVSTIKEVEVPESLRAYEIEQASAKDYDLLLMEGGER